MCGKDDSAFNSNLVSELAPLRHYTKELVLYFDKTTAIVRGGGVGEEAPLLKLVHKSLATDPGLHQLMPYFTQFVQEEVTVRGSAG